MGGPPGDRDAPRPSAPSEAGFPPAYSAHPVCEAGPRSRGPLPRCRWAIAAGGGHQARGGPGPGHGAQCIGHSHSLWDALCCCAPPRCPAARSLSLARGFCFFADRRCRSMPSPATIAVRRIDCPGGRLFGAVGSPSLLCRCLPSGGDCFLAEHLGHARLPQHAAWSGRGGGARTAGSSLAPATLRLRAADTHSLTAAAAPLPGGWGGCGSRPHPQPPPPRHGGRGGGRGCFGSSFPPARGVAGRGGGLRSPPLSLLSRSFFRVVCCGRASLRPRRRGGAGDSPALRGRWRPVSGCLRVLLPHTKTRPCTVGRRGEREGGRFARRRRRAGRPWGGPLDDRALALPLLSSPLPRGALLLLCSRQGHSETLLCRARAPRSLSLALSPSASLPPPATPPPRGVAVVVVGGVLVGWSRCRCRCGGSSGGGGGSSLSLSLSTILGRMVAGWGTHDGGLFASLLGGTGAAEPRFHHSVTSTRANRRPMGLPWPWRRASRPPPGALPSPWPPPPVRGAGGGRVGRAGRPAQTASGRRWPPPGSLRRSGARGPSPGRARKNTIHWLLVVGGADRPGAVLLQL